MKLISAVIAVVLSTNSIVNAQTCDMVTVDACIVNRQASTPFESCNKDREDNDRYYKCLCQKFHDRDYW